MSHYRFYLDTLVKLVRGSSTCRTPYTQRAIAPEKRRVCVCGTNVRGRKKNCIQNWNISKTRIGMEPMVAITMPPSTSKMWPLAPESKLDMHRNHSISATEFNVLYKPWNAYRLYSRKYNYLDVRAHRQSKRGEENAIDIEPIKLSNARGKGQKSIFGKLRRVGCACVRHCIPVVRNGNRIVCMIFSFSRCCPLNASDILAYMQNIWLARWIGV